MASRCQLPVFVIYFLQNIRFQLPEFSEVRVTIITTCVTTQCTYYVPVRAEQLQNPVCVRAHRDGSHVENVQVITACGAAVTASDIHPKLFSVKEGVERSGKQLSWGEKCIWEEELKK